MAATPPLRDLVSRAIAGDDPAREEILRTFLPRVRDTVHRQLELDFRRKHPWILPMFSTGDIVQEVLAGVVRDLEHIEAEDEEAFSRYLSTLVRNRLLDAVRHCEAARRDRRRHVQQDTQGGPPEPNRPATPAPPHAAMLGEQVHIFQEVLETFSQRHRDLLLMRLRDQEPFEAIAQQLGYASRRSARMAFVDAQSKLLLKLRARGLRGSEV
jgi:RNA polymerase sigma factor (sigma-70 family)